MTQITIDGVIGFDVLAKDIRAELKNANYDDIDMSISSPGGSVYEGIAIFNEIRDYIRKGGVVNARVIGLAASMASYIPLAANTVSIEDNAVWMIHNPWTIAAGNQNDMRKTADTLEGIATVLASAYVKKTGKKMSAVKKMMDEETYLFGEEIMKAGFADSIIPAGDGAENENEAFAFAHTGVESMKNAMAKNPEIHQLDKVAAMIQPVNNILNTPVSAGINTTEVKKSMNLKDLLKDNPDAKAEYMEDMAAAEAKGKESVSARINAAVKYIGNEAYKGIDVLAIKVLKGESEVAALDGAVAVIDMQRETSSVAAAVEETAEVPETPAGSAPVVSQDGMIRTEADIEAASAKLAAYI